MNSAIRAEPTADETRFIVERLREADREELDATAWELGDALVQRLQAITAFQYVAYAKGAPAAIFGAWPLWPTVWSVYAMGTDNFPALGMTKFIRRRMVPVLLDMGARRAECASIAGHHTAHRWLEALGAERECTMLGYGKRGEAFHRYVWLVR